MLIIALPSHPNSADPGYDHVLSDGMRVIRQDRAAASLLSHHAGDVVGVIAHQRLSWIEVELPPVRQKHQLHKIVSSLLEDKVLQDPDQLHIVWQSDTPTLAAHGGKVLIALCDKSWLRQVLAPLQQAGLTVGRLVPELTPSSTPVLHLLASDQNAQCWLTHARGVTRLPTNTMHWSALGVEVSQLTTIKAEPALSATVEQHFARAAQLVTPAQRWLQATQSPWDLAQGEWAQTGWSRWRRLAMQSWQLLAHDGAYRSARQGALALVMVAITGLNVVAWLEQSKVEAQRAVLTHMLTQAFPSVKLVIDAPLQMQREIDALAQSKGGVLFNDFEPLLSTTSAALPPSQTLTRIDYAQHELKLQGLHLSEAQTQQLAQQLSAAGLSMQSSASTLTISAGATP